MVPSDSPIDEGNEFRRFHFAHNHPRAGHLRPLIASIHLACIIVLLSLISDQADADEELIESFEGPEVSWQLRYADCKVEVSAHQRTPADPQNESIVEQIEFNAGHGSQIYFQHPIEPVCAIRELIPSVWLRSNRPNLQLSALVVLPYTRSTHDGEPIRFLVEGPSYRDVGRWQKLTFATVGNDIASMARQKALLYRESTQGEFDSDDAYVAALVINAFGEPGPCWLQVDDMSLEGNVSWQRFKPATRDQEGASSRFPHLEPNNSQAALDQAFQPSLLADPQIIGASRIAGNSQALITQSAGRIEINGVPFVARALHYRGESIRALGSLGFNVIVLDTPPTPVLAEEATAAGIWMVCPPHQETISNAQSLYRRVLAWNLGRGLLIKDLNQIKSRAVELANRTDLPQRPTYVQALQGVDGFGQCVDIVEVGRSYAGSSITPQAQFEWLRQRINKAPDRTSIWGTMPTQYPSRLSEQANLLHSRAFEPSLSPAWFEAFAIETIAAGCRGIVYESKSRLDELDADTAQRARVLAWINSQLQPIDPWIGAGTLLGADRTSEPGVVADTITTDRADLVIVRRRHPRTEPQTTEAHPVTLYIDRSPRMLNAFQLNGVTPEPLQHDRRTGTLRVRLLEFHESTFIVITQDPLALRHLHDLDSELIEQRLSLYVDGLAAFRTEFQSVLEQLGTEGIRYRELEQLSRQAGEAISLARRMILTNDFRAASDLLRSAQHHLSRAERLAIESQRSPFPNPLASPLLASFEWLPHHVQLANEISRLPWTENHLPSGNFEGLAHLEASGWTGNQGTEKRLNTWVAIEPSGNGEAAGGNALRLLVEPVGPLETNELLESTPLWVTSPALQLAPGHLIRIHGRIKFEAANNHRTGKLVVLDSIGGLELAEHYGSSPGWREFTLYRVVPDNRPFQLTMAMTGPGNAWLDDLSIRTADRRALFEQPTNDTSTVSYQR